MGKQVKCNICGKEFKTWPGLFSHLRTHKKQSRPEPGPGPGLELGQMLKNLNIQSNIPGSQNQIPGPQDYNQWYINPQYLQTPTQQRQVGMSLQDLIALTPIIQSIFGGSKKPDPAEEAIKESYKQYVMALTQMIPNTIIGFSKGFQKGLQKVIEEQVKEQVKKTIKEEFSKSETEAKE